MSEHDQPGPAPDPVFSTILAECPELWDVVEQFAKGLPHQVEGLRRALERSSYEQIAEWSKTLSNSGHKHGYPELVAYAAALERAARDHLIDSLKTRIDDLNELAKQIRAGIDLDQPVDEA